MTSYTGRGNKNAFRRILQVALMTSYTGAITRLSEEYFKLTSYTGMTFRRILQVALMTSYTGAITSFQKNPSSGIDDELHRGNNKAFRRILQVALMTSYTWQ